MALALVAISFGALIKGMTGLGLPLFAVPAIAMMTSVEEAVVLMIIPGLGSNLWLVGGTAGTIQGATGVSAHIVAPYYHGRNVPPEAYAFLVAFSFLPCFLRAWASALPAESQTTYSKNSCWSHSS
jgi:hypothetical protein